MDTRRVARWISSCEATADALIRVTTASLDFRIPRGLERSTAKTLLLAGEREPRQVRASLRDLAAAIPFSQACVAAGAIHAWNLSQSERFNATVRAWIRDQGLPPWLRPLGGNERATGQ